MPKEPEHGAFWIYDDPDLSLCITFAEDMNTALLPAASTFSLIVDDVPKTPDTLAWLNDRVLSIDYSEAALGPSVVDLDYPVTQPQLRFASGMQVGSFSEVGLEFDIAAGGAFIGDSDYEIDLTFPLSMDQTVTPLITDMTVIANGFDAEVTAVSWSDATTLDIEANLDGGGEINVFVALATPTPRLRALDQHQACPFNVLVDFG